MAILEGISGLQLGDADGGKIALDLDRRVLRILSAGRHSFLSATIPNLDSLGVGTIWFDRPEIIQNVAYDPTGANPDAGFDIPQSGKVKIDVDTRRQVKYEIEDFDLTRLKNVEYILGQVASGTAMSIEAGLNATFLAFLTNYFTTNAAGKLQSTVLPNLMKDETSDLTPEEARQDMRKMKLVQNRISKKFDLTKLGILQSEFITLTSGEVQINLEQAFWDQQGSLPMILGRETYTKFGKLITLEDNMLQNSIPAGTSFSKDIALDTTNFGAIIVHTEAVAFPFNYRGTKMLLDPINGNPKTITKYQYGIGFVRPELVWAFVETAIV